MTYDYSRLRGTADRLVSRFGQVATLIKPGPKVGPESNPRPGTPTEHPITAVDVSSLERSAGTLTGGVERRLIIAANGVRPDQADSIRLGDRTYEILTVSAVSPGGTTLLYEVQING